MGATIVGVGASARCAEKAPESAAARDAQRSPGLAGASVGRNARGWARSSARAALPQLHQGSARKGSIPGGSRRQVVPRLRAGTATLGADAQAVALITATWMPGTAAPRWSLARVASPREPPGAPQGTGSRAGRPRSIVRALRHRDPGKARRRVLQRCSMQGESSGGFRRAALSFRAESEVAAAPATPDRAAGPAPEARSAGRAPRTGGPARRGQVSDN